ncbi:MAG: biopolymer transporter ExbD [Mariprofundaceae bacterium]|nr:biopolymer transporter ExbD [Mariprofundaceae bacterium]
MQFEGARKSGQAPNLTPLIDIVFLLLVFFMLTANFMEYEVITIDLPKATSSTTSSNTENIHIILSKEGNVLVDDHIIAIAMLLPYLQNKLQTSEHRHVSIHGDQQTNLGLSVQVMDTARQAGASSIDIVTKQP